MNCMSIEYPYKTECKALPGASLCVSYATTMTNTMIQISDFIKVYSNLFDTVISIVKDVNGSTWLCESFDTDDGVVYFHKPIEVKIEPVDGYLQASYDTLGIEVLEKNMSDLQEYFREALMCDYYAYTFTDNDKLTKTAIRYKEWFLANVVMEQ